MRNAEPMYTFSNHLTTYCTQLCKRIKAKNLPLTPNLAWNSACLHVGHTRQALRLMWWRRSSTLHTYRALVPPNALECPILCTHPAQHHGLYQQVLPGDTRYIVGRENLSIIPSTSHARVMRQMGEVVFNKYTWFCVSQDAMCTLWKSPDADVRRICNKDSYSKH